MATMSRLGLGPGFQANFFFSLWWPQGPSIRFFVVAVGHDYYYFYNIRYAPNLSARKKKLDFSPYLSTCGRFKHMLGKWAFFFVV